MDQSDSCIIRHFSHYASLSDEEKRLLNALEYAPTKVAAGQVLWQEGQAAQEFCTIRSGWAFTYRHLEDGGRQIIDVYLPGDIVGLREFAFSQRLTGLAMIDSGVICRFPHHRLLELFRQSILLTTIMFAISSRHQAQLTERLVNLARRNAFQKLCHFLYEMHYRLERIGESNNGRFRLPLTQEQLADTLGLSAVHVSRTFSTLSEEGLVFRQRQWVEIPDLEALKRACIFDGCYLDDSIGSFGFQPATDEQPSTPATG